MTPTNEPTDSLDDLQPQRLTSLLASYVGAQRMREDGLVTSEYVAGKADQLMAACRAADVMLAVPLEHDSPIIAEAAKRFHERLTR